MTGHRKPKRHPLAIELTAARRREMFTRRLQDATTPVDRLMVARDYLLAVMKSAQPALASAAANEAVQKMLAIAGETEHAIRIASETDIGDGT